jgi:hypothetical protein
MKFAFSPILALALLALLPQKSFATDTLYWDIAGPTPGADTSSSGSLEGANWSINDSTGVSGPSAYETDSDIFFSAGSDYTGTQNVTVNGTDSVDGFTFNQGTVTLYGASSSSLSIGADGVTVDSTDGPTTFDSSLGTVTLGASQSWDNNSTKAFNVNSGVFGSGSSNTLTFDGNGTGNVYLNGIISGTLNLTQENANDALYLNNVGPTAPVNPPATYVGTINATQNSFTGTVTADGER